MSETRTTEQLERRVASLAHSLALAQAVAGKRGVSKRNAIRQLHHTDLRHSVGEERAESNPHVDRRRKREMKIRAEHTGAQRVMRRRSRDVYEGELDTLRLNEIADVAYEFDFATLEQVPDLPNEGV
jgi:hypothetical protein